MSRYREHIHIKPVCNLYHSFTYFTRSQHAYGLTHELVAYILPPIEYSFSQVHVCQMDSSEKVQEQIDESPIDRLVDEDYLCFFGRAIAAG